MADKLIILEKIINRIEGRAIPKPENNQNTDDMVYGGQLNLITFKGYGKFLYAEERKKNPNHPLDDIKYKGANILIGGENFGCGSSREHAPQAFLDYGIKALIAADYAGIFQSNCAATGLVAVTMEKDMLNSLVNYIKENPQTRLVIDINEKKVNYEAHIKKGFFIKDGYTNEGHIDIDIPDNVRESFLNGTWDALGILRSNPEEVKKTMDKIPYFKFK